MSKTTATRAKTTTKPAKKAKSTKASKVAKRRPPLKLLDGGVSPRAKQVSGQLEIDVDETAPVAEEEVEIVRELATAEPEVEEEVDDDEPESGEALTREADEEETDVEEDEADESEDDDAEEEDEDEPAAVADAGGPPKVKLRGYRRIAQARLSKAIARLEKFPWETWGIVGIGGAVAVLKNALHKLETTPVASGGAGARSKVGVGSTVAVKAKKREKYDDMIGAENTTEIKVEAIHKKQAKCTLRSGERCFFPLADLEIVSA